MGMTLDRTEGTGTEISDLRDRYGHRKIGVFHVDSRHVISVSYQNVKQTPLSPLWSDIFLKTDSVDVNL